VKLSAMIEKEKILHEKALKKALLEQQSLLEAANEELRYNIYIEVNITLHICI
jgi:hypothetical protein